MIKRSSIELLKNKVDILDVVGRYTTLKKRGASYVGLSPFTDEKTPSFYVEPVKGVYYCFSSNKGGDVVSFVQAMEKLDFNEAVEALAERYGVELEYDNASARTPQNRSLKKELLEIHLYAAEFYRKAFLADHPEANQARKYWTDKRKFSLQLAEDFQIGYAPSGSEKLLPQLQRHGFSQESLAQSGLFFFNRDQAKPRFRGRLMIPLRDPQGHVVGFSGRQMPTTPADDPAHDAKYVNSPETPIFKKGAMLFNFDRARKEVDKQGFFLMVEGQLDCLRATDNGFGATVAGQGTAITPQQLTLLKRQHNTLRVFLDGDRAGQKAALRLLPMALAAEIDITFLRLPPGMDPDLYFVQNPNSLDSLEVIYPVDFLFRTFLGGEAPVSATAKALAMEEIFEIIKASNSDIAREVMLESLAKMAHLDPRLVKNDFVKSLKSSISSSSNEIDEKIVKKINKNLTNAQSEILWLLVHHPELGENIAHTIDPELLDISLPHAKLLSRVLAMCQEQEWTIPEGIESASDTSQERDELYGLLARDLPVQSDPVTIADNAIRALYTRHFQHQLDQLKLKLRNTSDPQEIKNLLKSQQQLLILTKKIPSIKHG